MYKLLADIVLLAHLSFIAFALAGGLLLLRWPRLVWLHFPAMLWVVFIEVTGWICPLTPLENYFRAMGGADIYHVDFIGHYLLPLVYPGGLTPAIQLLLAGGVILFNIISYTIFIRVRTKARHTGKK